MALSSLPSELLLLIAGSLAAKDIASLLRINRSFNYILTPSLHEHALQDHESSPAICSAAEHGHVPLIRLLLEKYSQDPIRYRRCHPDYTNNTITPLGYAVYNGHDKAAALLLDSGANINSRRADGLSMLVDAVFNGHTAVVKLLLDRGVDTAHDGGPSSSFFLLAALKGHVEVTKLLFEYGVELLSPTNTDYSPLWAAATRNCPGMVRLLVEVGNMSPNTADWWGTTILHNAIHNRMPEIVQVLLDVGADIDTPNRFGYTAIMLAHDALSDEMACLFLEHGANIFTTYGRASPNTPERKALDWVDGKCPAFTRLLLGKLLHIEHERWNNIDDLHVFFLAVFFGHEAIVKLLLARGVDIRAKSREGETALHTAARSEHYVHDGMVTLLLSMGANVQAENNDGLTPIDVAVGLLRNSVASLLRAKMPYTIDH